MVKLESQASYCMSCCLVEFCQVNWGPDCKRQGGKKIPRMRFTGAKARQLIPKTVSKNTKKSEQKINEMFEPIRTKVVYW